MEKFIFYLSILLLYVIYSNTQVVIPLDSFQSQFEEESESQELVNLLLNSNIASIIKIGSQLYPLKTFFNINSPFFYISKQCNINEESFLSKYKTNFNYNRYKSITFYNTSSFDLFFGQSLHACTAIENFEVINYDKKEIKLEKISFILNEDTNEEKCNCLNIGLIENLNKETSFKEYNLITQLKQKNYIKEYIWTIKFNDVNKYNNNNLLYDPDELINLKGNLIIGDFPHNYDPQNYYKSQFIKTYTIFSGNIMKWELKFNKICYINNNKEQKIDDVYVNLDPSSYLIKAPEIYFESIIDNYFKKFLDEKICQFNYLDEYISINCDKSEKFSINEINAFPSILFDHINLNYTFELTYRDLFVEKDKVYYFLIISDSLFYKTGWILGNIFMRKYQFIFNLDTKEIGFYNPKLDKILDDNDGHQNSSNNSSNTIIYVIIIIVLCLFLVGIVLFIKMKFYPKISKKKRANELDDDYEYVTDKNVNNDLINNDNNDDNKLFNKNSNIN